MDIHTLKVLLEQVDIEIDKYRNNAVSGTDRIVLEGMERIRRIIKEDLERVENG